MGHTAHRDGFAEANLPPHDRWPELTFTLPELQYSPHLNCAEELLDRRVANGFADRRCIVGAGSAWTYTQTLEKANQIARVLVENMHVIPGNRVLLRAPNCPMLAACWLAVIKAGAIAVTTMPLYRAAELHYMTERARVRHALCDVRVVGDLRAASEAIEDFRIVTFGDGGELESLMRTKSGQFTNVRTAANDVALIGFTSGTTGKPKAAMHFHRDVMAICDTYAKHVLRATSDDLFAGSPPLGFTFGLGGLLLFPLYSGAATLLLEKATPELLLQAIAEHHVSVVFTAPVAYRAMAELTERYGISSLRTCVSAGETLPLPVFERWHERTGLEIMDGIGSTEMLHIFVGSPKECIRPGATGQPVPGYVAEIHDDEGHALPPNAVGHLAVKGPTGCRYLDDERQTSYVRRGWNYPGDAYRMDEDGYFWYVARTDDMIIAAGYNISGPEVEEALLAHRDVRECAVVAQARRGPPYEHRKSVRRLGGRLQT